MPGRDFAGVLPTEPPWQLPTYHQHYTYEDDGYTLFSGDKVRLEGRNGWCRFVAHRDHPRESGLDVCPEGGVRFTVKPEKVRPVGKGTR